MIVSCGISCSFIVDTNINETGDVMDTKYKQGQTVYIIENGYRITECIIVNYRGGLYTIRFPETNCAIRLRESRLFPTKEDAKKSIH